MTEYVDLIDRNAWTHRMSDQQRAECLAWLEPLGYSIDDVRSLAWNTNPNTITLQTYDRDQDGRTKTVLIDGEVRASTTLTRLHMVKPPDWWPRTGPTTRL